MRQIKTGIETDNKMDSGQTRHIYSLIKPACVNNVTDIDISLSSVVILDVVDFVHPEVTKLQTRNKKSRKQHHEHILTVCGVEGGREGGEGVRERGREGGRERGRMDREERGRKERKESCKTSKAFSNVPSNLQ